MVMTNHCRLLDSYSHRLASFVFWFFQRALKRLLHLRTVLNKRPGKKTSWYGGLLKLSAADDCLSNRMGTIQPLPGWACQDHSGQIWVGENAGGAKPEIPEVGMIFGGPLRIDTEESDVTVLCPPISLSPFLGLTPKKVPPSQGYTRLF